MEALIKYARLAWNPIGAVQQKIGSETLTFQAVLLPYLAVIVGCELLSISAQKFLMESMGHAAGQAVAFKDPVLNSQFAMKFLASLGALFPAAVVGLLPARTFQPYGKSATSAAMLIVVAAWTFYSAAVSVTGYFFAGLFYAKHAGLAQIMLGGVVLGELGVLVIGIWLWFRILRREMQLNGGAVATVTVMYLLAIGLEILFGWAVF